MIKKLQTIPFYVFLLPVFFVLHAMQESFGLIKLTHALPLLGMYCMLSCIIYGFFYLLFREYRKAAVITVLCMGFFFFFGAFHEFLKEYSPFYLIGRYVFLLPVSFILFIWLFVYLKKTSKKFEQFSLVLNILFVLYIILDASIIIWKSFNPEKQNLSLFNFPEFEHARIPDTSSKPDIYFLLFDEYAGSKSLKDKYKFNNDIDGYLLQKGFSIQENSRSNYNFTGFSMSSILNMTYIDNFKNPGAATANDYVGCNYLIKNNRVINFLEQNGYEIVNYSIFDLKDNPALVQQYFLPHIIKLITERTFFKRVSADIGWHLFTRLNLPVNPKNPLFNHIKINSFLLNLVSKSSPQKSTKPRFFYVHLFLPHAPFFFDKNGRRRENKEVLLEDDFNSPTSYIEYLQYTNTKIKELLSSILYNNVNAVIILMGDHGYRTEIVDPHYDFQIMNAIYYSDKDYKLLYDNISGVNQFRAVFNKLFNQSFPMLKDSFILIKDKQRTKH